MKGLLKSLATPASRKGHGPAQAFTLVEMLVAFGIGTTVLAGGMAFTLFAVKGLSGITAQTLATQKAGDALQLIQNSIRLATMVSNDAAGNTLTVAFDTNDLVDSGNGGNGIAWANQDYFSQFKFVGVNTTNVTACASNQLIYIPDTRSSFSEVLIPAGVRNLPGHNIFSVTNTVLVTICYGVVDVNPQDYYQGVEIQAMSASLNRPQVNNMFTILPAP